MAWHGYVLIELKGAAVTNGFDNTRERDFVRALRRLVNDASDQPAHRLQWRVRLDRRAAIVEGRWRGGSSKAVMVSEIAQETGLTALQVGALFDLTRLGFVRDDPASERADWDASRAAALAYLAANAAAWEG